MNPQDNSFGKYKYANGKIYKLCCKDPTITEIYIGSTLDQYTRKYAHKTACNNPNSKNKMYNYYLYQFIRENGGFENWNLVILEEYPSENKNDLLWKEREWIERLQPSLNCMKRPVVTTDERDKNQKEYKEANREKILKHKKEYREANKDKILEYREANKDKILEYREANRGKRKEYLEANKDKISKQHKEYYEANKDKLLQYQKEYQEFNKQRVNCDICNKELARASLTRHKRTIHKDT